MVKAIIEDFDLNSPFMERYDAAVPYELLLPTNSHKPDSITFSEAQPAQRVPTYTAEQIRYWKNRENQKMFISGTQTLPPRSAIDVPSFIHSESNLVLPSRIRQYGESDWFLFIAMAVLVIFAIIRNLADKYISGVFIGITNYNTASRIFRESNVGFEWASTLLEIFSYVTISMFAFQLATHQYLSVPFEGFLLFPVLFVGVTGFLLIKKLMHSISGYLFSEQTLASEFIFNQNNSVKVAGIFLFPVVGLIEWGPIDNAGILFAIGIVLFGFVYLLLLLRGINIFLQKQLPIFYLFLYLCTLEFLPTLVVFKLLVV